MLSQSLMMVKVEKSWLMLDDDGEVVVVDGGGDHSGFQIPEVFLSSLMMAKVESCG